MWVYWCSVLWGNGDLGNETFILRVGSGDSVLFCSVCDGTVCGTLLIEKFVSRVCAECRFRPEKVKCWVSRGCGGWILVVGVAVVLLFPLVVCFLCLYFLVCVCDLCPAGLRSGWVWLLQI